MPSWVDELAIKLGASRVGPVHSAGNAFRLGTGVVRRVAEASEPKLTVLHLFDGVGSILSGTYTVAGFASPTLTRTERVLPGSAGSLYRRECVRIRLHCRLNETDAQLIRFCWEMDSDNTSAPCFPLAGVVLLSALEARHQASRKSLVAEFFVSLLSFFKNGSPQLIHSPQNISLFLVFPLPQSTCDSQISLSLSSTIFA